MLTVKLSPWARLRHVASAHHTVSLTLAAAMVLGAGVLGWFTYAAWSQPQQSATQPQPNGNEQTAVPEVPKKYYSPLTGVEVPDEATTKRQVTAIMLENSPVSRPQSGLQPAGVVYEAIAEGGITRLLTLHQEDRPGLIGPIRSIRPYYVDWLAPYDAAVAHVGGSANALKEVRNGNYKDIDQFFNGASYYRATDRAAPHNVYTTFDRLDALNQRKGFTSSTFTPFPRKLDSPLAAPNTSTINITVSSASYNVAYTYDPATNSYLRSIGGAPSTDREAGRITPKVVIAIKVPSHIGFEDGYREQMDTIGHNSAYIFQDGTVIQGFWRKNSKKEVMQFYDASGRTIALNAGQTWITVVKPDKAVTWQ